MQRNRVTPQIPNPEPRSPNFQSFVARKTAEADAAAIAPLVTDIDAADATLASIGNSWTRALFDGAFYLSPIRDEGLPCTNLVFVRSRDGNTVAKDPSTLGGGNADKHLIYEGLSRAAADAVLGGAGTVRDGRLVLSVWRRELVELRASLGLPRHPAQIVATLHGVPLEHGLLFNTPALRVFLVTTMRGIAAMRPALDARPWITPLVMASPAGLPAIFRQLRARGIARLSCIGGRTLAGQLVDDGLIQDLYLTTTPASAGEPETPFYSKPLPAIEVVRKRGTGPDQGVVFQHLRLA
jgi:5-amino-6-(5-phosphoribosylamino)uracil reductase